MTNLADFETADYRPTPSQFERRCTTAVMRAAFGKLPFSLDFGDGDVRPMAKGEHGLHLAPPRLFALLNILSYPGLKLGQAFMDGKWMLTKGEIADFLLLMVTQEKAEIKKFGLTFGFSEWTTYIYKQFVATFSATRETARHYDVNTEFYKLMIEPELVYSCAFFDDDLDDLGLAQQRKYGTIQERMELDTADELKILDIGCGWGSFERYLPPTLSGRIDGISISEGQISYAQTQSEKLSGNANVEISFIKQDYRFFCEQHKNEYNRVVSVGMLEHVGKSKYVHYFESINQVLTGDGLALVHSIVSHTPRRTNQWIDRYIFPGGNIPTISDVVDGVERAGLKIKAVHFHVGMNYIKTLEVWLDNVRDRATDCLRVLIEEQDHGTDEDKIRVAKTTMRMFVYYLSAVQSMFHPKHSACGIGHFIVTR